MAHIHPCFLEAATRHKPLKREEDLTTPLPGAKHHICPSRTMLLNRACSWAAYLEPFLSTGRNNEVGGLGHVRGEAS